MILHSFNTKAVFLMTGGLFAETIRYPLIDLWSPKLRKWLGDVMGIDEPLFSAIMDYNRFDVIFSQIWHCFKMSTFAILGIAEGIRLY